MAVNNVTERVYKLNIEGEDSVKDLQKAIEQLTKKLESLNETSKEYESTIEKLNKLQGQLAETMSNASEAFGDFGDNGKTVVETINGLTEGLEGAATATTEINDSMSELDVSLTKEAESMKELRSQIKGLQDHLVKLNVGSKEYEKTVELLTQKNQKLQDVMSVTKNQVTAAKGSYNALTQELAALRKEWKATADEAERARIGKRMAEINAELKQLDSTVGNFQRNVGDYRNALNDVFGNPRKEIRLLREELAHLTVGSEEYNQVLAKMADLTQKQKHFQDQLKFSSANLEDIFTNMAGVARGVAGGFSALNSLMGLMGNQNSDLQKAMLKTQQLMALVQGLSAMEGLRDRIKGLVDGIKGFTSRFGMLNKNTKEFNENTRNVSTETERATGSLNEQAGVVSKLAQEYEHLNDAEKETADKVSDEISSIEAKIAVLKEEIAINREKIEILKEEGDAKEKIQSITDESLRKLDDVGRLENELNTRKETIDTIVRESRERRLMSGEITKEQLARMENLDQMELEQGELIKEISFKKRIVESYTEEIAKIDQKIAKGEELTEIEEAVNANGRERVKILQEEIEKDSQKVAANQKIIDSEKAIITADNARIAKLKQLEAQRSKLNKWQLLAIAQNKMETAETKLLIKAQAAEMASKKALAGTYNTLAVAARVASVAIKGVKTALISSGIGALLVLFGSALSNLIDSLGDLFSGSRKLNAELDIMSTKTKEIKDNLSELNQIADGFGFSSFKKASMELKEMQKIVKSTGEAYHYAVEQGKKDTEELRDAWYEAQDSMNEKLLDGTIMINKLIADVDKADRQKGMTQLEKDLDETNNKFQEAIELVKTFGEMGIWSADMVDAKINSLNNALEKQKQMLIENANTATTSTTKTGKSEYEKQKEEADKLYKELIEENKREEQKLKEKYEKEKKLLEKFHKDTTLLTKKYYEDLDKLLTERQKVEYDKWVTHLNSMLSLEEQNSIRYYEMQIDNMRQIFRADFGADENTPFEKLFDIQILDEFGSKAIAITDDIAESMKMIGLDPTDIADIQTFIDKWYADKKAIDDNVIALKKLKSELKFNEFSNEGDAIEAFMEARLNYVTNMTDLAASKSFNGFYSGLSPEDEKAEFEERYRIMEESLNKELDLWTNAMNDESLTAEDRNKALQKYNQTMAKINETAVQKEIDANNLLIKSFQRVSDAIGSMATNLANILGSVSDLIMSTAQRQLEAGEITNEEFEKQFERSKAIQIAVATINTIAGAVGAFMGITRDTGGWGIAAAAIEAAAVLASGFAQIAQIRATKPDTSSSGGGGGSDSTVFNLPSVMTPEPTRVQNTTNQSDIDALANALGDQRVYVLESDIRNANDKANKRLSEVKF